MWNFGEKPLKVNTHTNCYWLVLLGAYLLEVHGTLRVPPHPFLNVTNNRDVSRRFYLASTLDKSTQYRLYYVSRNIHRCC